MRNQSNTHATVKAIQSILHGIRCMYEHLELLEHRPTTGAGKPVSILRGIAKKIVTLSGSLFSSRCLVCFMIFVLARHKSVKYCLQNFNTK